MKRSEAIQFIVDNCLIAIGELEVSKQDIADDILTHLEKLGMLPPEAEFLYKRDLGEGLEVSFFKKDRKWESES